MKKFKIKKRKRGNIFSLLIKNYVIFTIVVMAIGILIMFLVYVIFNKKTEFSFGLTDNDIKILREENFIKLNVKNIAGNSGIIHILDEKGNVIYTSSKDNSNKDYTERQLKFIPEYDYCYYTHTNIYKFKGGNGKDYNILLLDSNSDYKEFDVVNNIEQYEYVNFKVLDSNLNVLYDSQNNSDGIISYTEEELGYLSGTFPKDYYLSKYSYINNEGIPRIAIIEQKRINGDVYEKLDQLTNLSFGLFFLACIICIIIFVIVLRKKVEEPLYKLNMAMHLFSEGKNNDPISYTGPKEFVDICDSFNIMSNKLKSSEIEREKLIKDKYSILADISHDLKTPITTIQGYAKALSDGVISKEDYEKYFNIIYAKSNRLTELINIFYEYSKLEHPDFKLLLESVELSEYIRVYVASRYEEIIESGFDIEIDIPEKAYHYNLDTIQFKRVLDNIITNSIKHNPKGTEIYVGLKEEIDKYKIIIADNGVGIPKDISKNIFEPFIVGDDSRNTKQGSGLGLAITKTIIEMHGGRIILLNGFKNYNTVFEIVLQK